MRARPVTQDTVDLLVTAIVMSSTDITQSPAQVPVVPSGRSPAAVLEEADRLGQQLWDDNYASVNFTGQGHTIVPQYEWRPVAELMGDRIDTEKILQIERSRLPLEASSRHNPGWDTSETHRHLHRLGQSIPARLHFHPRAASPHDLDAVEYIGLSRAAEEWAREIGFRTPLAAGDAHRQVPAI